MNKVEQDKLFFTEAKRQITLLKKQNAEMLEALKEILQCYKDECRIPNVKVIHETEKLLNELK